MREGTTARGYLAVSKEVGEYGRQLIAQPEGWGEHEAAELAYVLAEETRLLDVAATRARELLVVSRWEKETETGGRPWRALEEYLGDAPELVAARAKPARKSIAADLSANARAAAAKERERRRGLACGASWAVTSVTGEKRAGGGREGGTAEEKAEGGGLEGGTTSDSRLNAGPAWGSLVHGLLEYAGRHPHATRADFERLARWLVVETPELEPVTADAVDLVERVVRAPFWKDATVRGEVLVEVPFAVRLAAGDSLGGISAGTVPAVVEGVIDLAHRDGKGWRILDYKTDIASEDDAVLLARHGGQLQAYRAAWERTTRTKVRGSAIVAVRTLRVVTVGS